jgi:hypothetical protein
MEAVNGPYMVFDVESAGLHGEGFAVGWIVVTREGVEIDSGCVVSPFATASGGSVRDRDWVTRNVLPGLPLPNADTPKVVRDRFWADWRRWAQKGASLYAECGWPVEARFLAACIDDDPENRHWDGPFPLHEIATFEEAADLNKNEVARLVNELPRHNPLADARMSARMLLKALNKIGR